MLISCVHPLWREMMFIEKNRRSSIRFSELISCILLPLFKHSCLYVLIPTYLEISVQFFQTFSLVLSIKKKSRFSSNLTLAFDETKNNFFNSARLTLSSFQKQNVYSEGVVDITNPLSGKSKRQRASRWLGWKSFLFSGSTQEWISDQMNAAGLHSRHYM